MTCFSRPYKNVYVKASLYSNNHIKVSGSQHPAHAGALSLKLMEAYGWWLNPESQSVDCVNLNPSCLGEKHIYAP